MILIETNEERGTLFYLLKVSQTRDIATTGRGKWKDWALRIEGEGWVQTKFYYVYHMSLPVAPLVSKNTGPPPMLPLTPSIRANLMSSDGFQCRFLWFMNQLLICFWSSPVTSDSFNFSSSCFIPSIRYLQKCKLKKCSTCSFCE